VLLDREILNATDLALARLSLERSVVASPGDRFIVRSYSPARTLGGGRVLDIDDNRRYRRFRKECLEALRERQNACELVAVVLRQRRTPFTLEEVAREMGVPREAIARAARDMITLPGNFYISPDALAELEGTVKQFLEAYHSEHPLRPGPQVEALRAKTSPSLEQRSFWAVLDHWKRSGKIMMKHDFVYLPEKPRALSGVLADAVKALENAFLSSGFSPPSPEQALRMVKEHYPVIKDRDLQEVFSMLVREGVLIRATKDLFFHSENVKEAKSLIARQIQALGSITVAQARDLLRTSRKFALPLLEHLDGTGFTRRVGDERKLGGKP